MGATTQCQIQFFTYSVCNCSLVTIQINKYDCTHFKCLYSYCQHGCLVFLCLWIELVLLRLQYYNHKLIVFLKINSWISCTCRAISKIKRYMFPALTVFLMFSWASHTRIVVSALAMTCSQTLGEPRHVSTAPVFLAFLIKKYYLIQGITCKIMMQENAYIMSRFIMACIVNLVPKPKTNEFLNFSCMSWIYGAQKHSWLHHTRQKLNWIEHIVLDDKRHLVSWCISIGFFLTQLLPWVYKITGHV